MTKAAIAGLGYEQMKLFVKPRVYLWLASEGWRQCYEIEATPIEGTENIGVMVTSWGAGTLIPDFNPN